MLAPVLRDNSPKVMFSDYIWEAIAKNVPPSQSRWRGSAFCIQHYLRIAVVRSGGVSSVARGATRGGYALAQESLSVTVRLSTGLPGTERRLSAQK